MNISTHVYSAGSLVRFSTHEKVLCRKQVSSFLSYVIGCVYVASSHDVDVCVIHDHFRRASRILFSNDRIG